MRLSYCPDTAAADWLARSDAPAMQLITFGPAQFEAYARLRFIPDPAHPGQSENDAEVPDDHPSDLDQTRRALQLLTKFTSTPQDCYFCVWEGYSDIPLPPEGQRGPLVQLPFRSYALLQGAPSDVGARDDTGGLSIRTPAFVWPADRRWCFVSDVDPHWAGIGAEQAAIDALLHDPQLDVVPANPAELQPHYR